MSAHKMSFNCQFLNCCWNNDLHKVSECLNQGVDVNTIEYVWPRRGSGLTIAAEKNYPELADLLLSTPGIDVNLVTIYYMNYKL